MPVAHILQRHEQIAGLRDGVGGREPAKRIRGRARTAAGAGHDVEGAERGRDRLGARGERDDPLLGAAVGIGERRPHRAAVQLPSAERDVVRAIAEHGAAGAGMKVSQLVSVLLEWGYYGRINIR